MSIEEVQKEIISEFAMFDDWQERYEYLIDLGKNIDKLDEADKTESNIIKGCQSKVWLKPTMDDGKIYFTADSDAILPKGIAALLVRMFSGQRPSDILNSSTDFISEIGLQEFLSPSRANGLLAMIKQIKFYAIAYQSKNKDKPNHEKK